MKKRIIKIVAFFALFCTLFHGVSGLLLKVNARGFSMIGKFYEEPPNSLDVIYIGPSGVFASWCAPLVWEKYGITSWGFSSADQPLSSAKYLIEETRKRHPNAVYVLALQWFSQRASMSGIHNLVDYMPPSVTKNKLIYTLASENDGAGLESILEYYLPLVRYHSRWNELTKQDFSYEAQKFKSANSVSSLRQISDVTKGIYSTTDRKELSEEELEIIEDLLSYCKSQQLPVVFVFTPIFDGDKKWIEWAAKKNTVIDLCSAYGYEVMDQSELRNEIGLDTQCDFYDSKHTNVHGAIKVTNYLTQYLVEHYDFEDKRDLEEYSSWDKAYEDYTEFVSPSVLDVEWTGDTLNSDLSAPVLTQAVMVENDVVITWEAVEGADGYCVYKKPKNGAWERVASVDAQTLQYTDTRDVSKNNVYTVISFQVRDDAVSWGRYNYSGIKVVA